MKFLSKIYDFMFAPAGTFDTDSGLFESTSDEYFSAADTVDHNVQVAAAPELIINPATNLPMMDGYGSVDIAGSPFGTDVHHQFDTGIIDFSTTFPDCGGSGIDYGSSAFDSGFSVDCGSTFDSGSMFD